MMTFRLGWDLRQSGFGLVAALAFLVQSPGRPSTQASALPDESRSPASAPAPPHEATKRITLPKGFRATLCAAEPDVVQPIAMTIDPKGRLWVVENYSYPIWLGGPHGKDRILIFEDTDGDGRFDRRKIFCDRGTN